MQVLQRTVWSQSQSRWQALGALETATLLTAELCVGAEDIGGIEEIEEIEEAEDAEEAEETEEVEEFVTTGALELNDDWYVGHESELELNDDW